MKRKRIKAAVCAAVMAFTLFGSLCPVDYHFMRETSVTASAEAAIWDGTEDTSWYYREHDVVVSENGERIAIFNIRTAEELAGLAKLVRNGNNMKNTMINLVSDVTLNDTTNFDNWDEQPPANNWTAIGAVPIEAPNVNVVMTIQPECRNTVFAGMFNGNGHTISGIYSLHHNYAGLFARTSGIITNVIVKDSYIQCINTQKVESGDTALWEACAGGITAICDRGVISHCEFDGKIFASGLNQVGYGTHGSFAGGIVGKFSDDENGVAAVVMMFALVPAGFLINPALFLTASGQQVITDPGIYSCINRGSIYTEHGTDENGAGGIIGAGGLYTVRNPDFAVFYCLNLGEVHADHQNIGGMVGEGYKFSEQKSYYTNCERSSENDDAINFVDAGMSLEEVAEEMDGNYKYENGVIMLNFDGNTKEEPSETMEKETFTRETVKKNITMPAPELSCSFLTHYFGTVVDKDNVQVSTSTNSEVSNWSIDVAGDPKFTDIYLNDFTIYDLIPEVTYYVRVQGRTLSDRTDPECEYTDYGYLSITLKDDGSLDVNKDFVAEDEKIKGDVNADGALNVADVVLLQKWLLAVPGVKLGEGKVADLYEDGNLNVLDLAVMKQKLSIQ